MHEDFTSSNGFDSEADPFFDGLSFCQLHSKLPPHPILPFSFDPECPDPSAMPRPPRKQTIYNRGPPAAGSPKSRAIAGRTTELRRLKDRRPADADSSEEDFPEFAAFAGIPRRRRAKRRKRKVADREGIARRTSELRKSKTPPPFSRETEDEFVERLLAGSCVPASQNHRAASAGGREIRESPQAERPAEAGLPAVTCVVNGRADRFRELRARFPLPSSFQRRRFELRRPAETVASRLRAEVSRQRIADRLSGGPDGIAGSTGPTPQV
jgi:hypothetical protein